MKSKETHIGDTLHLRNQSVDTLERFKPPKPMVFAGVYPMDQSQFVSLQAAIDKLTLNDSAVTITLESRYIKFLIVYIVYFFTSYIYTYTYIHIFILYIYKLFDNNRRSASLVCR